MFYMVYVVDVEWDFKRECSSSLLQVFECCFVDQKTRCCSRPHRLRASIGQEGVRKFESKVSPLPRAISPSVSLGRARGANYPRVRVR